MFLKGKARPPEPEQEDVDEGGAPDDPTIIQPDLTIFGEVRSAGAVQVYGRVEGTPWRPAVNDGAGFDG